MKKTHWISIVFLGWLALGETQAQGEVETWTRVRGVDAPGTFYSAFVQTASGRLLAAGRGGQLMISDDGGASWDYQVIRVNDEPFFGVVTDMMADGGSIQAIATRLVPGTESLFQGQTLLLSSSDNGNTWSVTPFPFDSASFFGLELPGLALTGLHRDVGGNLVAYGTTQVSNGAVLWSIGGAVFRQTGSWEQAYFALGPINTMANGNGRVIAGGFQTLLDSPDGAAWNGYFLRNANMQSNGTLLDAAVREKLDITDLAFFGGEFVMAAQTYVPVPGFPRIFTGFIDQAFTFTSANPFDGSRTWDGTEQPRVYRSFQQRGGNLLSLFSGVNSLGSGGWSEVDATVDIRSGSYGPVDTQSIVAIGSSDAVWRSDNAGSSWTQILDRPFVPDLVVRASASNVLFATRRFGDMLWASRDNGLTWFELSDFRAQVGRFPEGISFSGDRLYAGTGDADRLAYSDDLGITWTAVDLPVSSSADLDKIFVGENGRLIAAPEGMPAGVEPIGPFFRSDDDGETWTPTEVNIRFGEFPEDMVVVGGGRLIFISNAIGGTFDPTLFVSDDNGETWRREDPFQSIEDLDRVFNEMERRVIDLRQITRSDTGRLLIRGSDEILTSDDRGDTWQVRLNLDLRNARGLESNLLWRLWGLEKVGERWIALGSRRPRPFGTNDGIKFVLISEDDGSTWREVVLPIAEEQELEHLILGLNSRLVASGNQGGIFVTDFELEPGLEPAAAEVREGESLALQIPRPPLDGVIDAVYFSTPLDADAVTDFVATQGTLNWASNDTASQVVMIDTVDDENREPDENFTVDVYVDGDLLVSTKYLVTIKDDDGSSQAGIELIDGQSIVTSEGGGTDFFRLALQTAPTDNVTVNLENLDSSEISLSATSLTFTPDNWNDEQRVDVTGQDDADQDGDVTASIRVTTQTTDANYEEVGLRLIGVVNLDNESVVFADGFEGSN